MGDVGDLNIVEADLAHRSPLGEVAVSGSGQGRIKQVFLDGNPYSEAMKDAAR
jgi:hypothetical protein